MLLCVVCRMTGWTHTLLLEQAVYGDEALSVGVDA